MKPEPVAEKIQVHVGGAARQAGGFLRSKYGLWALAGISFLESALIIPIITDPFLVAYILSDREKAVRGVVVTTISSVAGGVAAYFMAVGFFEFLTTRFFNEELLSQFNATSQQMNEGTFIMTLIGAVTPVPYTLVGLAAGFVGASLTVFIIASILGRGFRYVLVGWVTYHFGDKALKIAQQRIKQASIAVAALVVVYIYLKF